MTSTKKDPVLIVLQLSGGNDFMNTIVPYGDPLYQDHRPGVNIESEQITPINDHVGFRPNMDRIQGLYAEGKVAVIQGIGYPNPNRSHFRAMDIWHSCEPEKTSAEGWLGRAVKDIDPHSENVLTAVNFGRGLPLAMVAPNVPVSSVGNLDTYGVLTAIEGEEQRFRALDVFSRMYSPALGRSSLIDYLSQTGTDALKGADILKTAPGLYESTIEYARESVSKYMRNIAQVHFAGLGCRVLYTTAPYNSFDTHANEAKLHTQLWRDIDRAVGDFYDDLKEHHATDEVALLLFTEFGRRVHDNGSGTDHGSGGGAFLIGDSVKGGLYGEYPSLRPEDLLEGDLRFNNDFRGLYSSILEQWMGLDAKPIVGGQFEQMNLLN